MGLDQYAKAVYPKKVTKVLGVPVDETFKREVEICYWRKHPNLQGWMEQLYLSKGGKEVFNCQEVELTEEDLNNLENAINNKELPSTQGFFFGEEADEYYYKEDTDFIRMAREYIRDGAKVFYSSWW